MNDTVAGIYKDGRYAADNPGCGEENAGWKAPQVIRMMEKAGLKPQTVCEIGCGSGGIQRLMRLPRRLLMKIAPDFAVRLPGGNPMTVLARPAAPPLPL